MFLNIVTLLFWLLVHSYSQKLFPGYVVLPTRKICFPFRFFCPLERFIIFLSVNMGQKVMFIHQVLYQSYVQNLIPNFFKLVPLLVTGTSNRNTCIYITIAERTLIYCPKSWFTSLSSPKRYTGNKVSEISIFYVWHNCSILLTES